MVNPGFFLYNCCNKFHNKHVHCIVHVHAHDKQSCVYYEHERIFSTQWLNRNHFMLQRITILLFPVHYASACEHTRQTDGTPQWRRRRRRRAYLELRERGAALEALLQQRQRAAERVAARWQRRRDVVGVGRVLEVGLVVGRLVADVDWWRKTWKSHVKTTNIMHMSDTAVR